MEELDQEYNFKAVEKEVQDKWASSDCFSYKNAEQKKRFSMFLTPPNASGPIHVGNALMVAIQDILARYYRTNGYSTLWVPGIDHGGYETQVTFEREREAAGENFSREEWRSRDLFSAIESFVEENKSLISQQLKSLGASVDWSKLRYTMDDSSLDSVQKMFQKMVDDNLVSRQSYMMNYCSDCATVLADIELKKEKSESTLYRVSFPFSDGSNSLAVGTVNPEFLFSAKYILVHPHDVRFCDYIGAKLINPVSGEEVEILTSERKLNLHEEVPYLEPFLPSFNRFDYEYAIRHGLEAEDLLDWDGRLKVRHEGLFPDEAREREIEALNEVGAIDSTETKEVETSRCKKGHVVNNIIRDTWFLDVDGKVSIRSMALKALEEEDPKIYPAWRKKGLVDWIGKMHNWPIARQNAWGIRLPVWYEVTDASKFLVWFFDEEGERRYGNLQEFLNEGLYFDEIVDGLQRVYAESDCQWVTEREEGKRYLPETDTFDTWFSSGAWATIVYESLEGVDFEEVYPSNTLILGHDLLRLSVARKVMLSTYLSGQLPFKRVYMHPLLLGADGQKMSKSIGNVESLESYLNKYGADVTRMGLTAYSGQTEDFSFENEKLDDYAEFVEKIRQLARVYFAFTESGLIPDNNINFKRSRILNKINRLKIAIGKDVENHYFARAQNQAVDFVGDFQRCLDYILEKDDMTVAKEFMKAFEEYLLILHPFAPHLTEYLHQNMNKDNPGFLAEKG